MLIRTRTRMIMTGTTQTGKFDPSGNQKETMSDDAESSAGTVSNQLVKYR